MGGAVFLSKDIQCGRNERRVLPILAFCFFFFFTKYHNICKKNNRPRRFTAMQPQASTALRWQVKSSTHTSKSKIKRSSRLLKSVVEGQRGILQNTRSGK